jgi:hypothetical protein
MVEAGKKRIDREERGNSSCNDRYYSLRGRCPKYATKYNVSGSREEKDHRKGEEREKGRAKMKGDLVQLTRHSTLLITDFLWGYGEA